MRFITSAPGQRLDPLPAQGIPDHCLASQWLSLRRRITGFEQARLRRHEKRNRKSYLSSR
jgi:hypothetical protein